MLAVQADIAEGQDFGSRLIRIFASWSKLLETIALSKVILRRKSFVLYENISLDVREEIWLAKEAMIKLCQEELKNNLKKIRQQYCRLDVYIDDRGVVRSGGRLDKSNLPDEIKRLIIVPGQHLLAHLMAEHYHQKLILNPWDMLKVAEKQVTKFWDIWMRHIPPQLLFPNKWFRSRDNLKVGDFVINLQPGMKKMQLYPQRTVEKGNRP